QILCRAAISLCRADAKPLRPGGPNDREPRCPCRDAGECNRWYGPARSGPAGGFPPEHLVRAQEGCMTAADPDDLVLFLDRYLPSLLLLARGHIHPALRAKMDPADAVQEVLLKAHAGRDRCHSTDPAGRAAWLRAILVNTLRE